MFGVKNNPGEIKFNKRLFDIVVSLFLILILAIPFIIICILIKISDRGPIIHWSERIGASNKRFLMPKFRTMRINTPQVATHLLKNPNIYITPLGLFLRKSSLDEIPQIWSVLCGDMSLVGPRPALFNQDDLMALRAMYGVHHLVPGITGWAQINGRDELSLEEKVAFDFFYLKHQKFFFDIKIILKTIIKVVTYKNVMH